MKQLADNIWVYEQPHSLLGVQIGARMTVVRTGGGLWLHSPIDTAALQGELNTLGQVRALVAPNVGHYVGLKEAHQTFPNAALFSPPQVAEMLKLQTRLAEFSVDEEMCAQRLRGSKIFDETVFLHVPSRTLILTDLCMNLRRLAQRERIIARLAGIPPRFGTTRFTKLLSRDRDAMRPAAREILAWDFDRVIISHGDIIETGGKPLMRQALAWLR